MKQTADLAADQVWTTEVTVPLWALKFILENANFRDEGLGGGGWESDEMGRSRIALEQAMKEVPHAGQG